ncbi:MAG TPA: hypothetical protein VET51_15425 [Burkholderiales bacterium]|nr:hypothetical protein [Burkholderiales bacterium]
MKLRSSAIVMALNLAAFPSLGLTQGTDQGKLGSMSFPVACDSSVQQAFNRAVALQINYFWAPATKAFNEVLARDPACAMAYWGIAVVNLDNLLAAPPSAKQMTDGAAAIAKAKAIGGKSARERDYIAAVDEFYRDYDKTPHGERLGNYERALERLHQRYPDDHNAAAYYALALLATHPPKDQTYAKPLKAAKLLEAVFAAEPNHPGAAHFLIHAYDYPPIAKHGVAAARKYAAIAPDAPHALHMPSHIFTRLGYWQESIDTNLRSAKSCDTQRCELHALDYAMYGYLQLGRDQEAKRLADRIFAWPEAEQAFVGGYALAAMPARYALERGKWSEAAGLKIASQDAAAWGKVPPAESVIVFARGLGAARAGNVAQAKSELERLRAIHQALVAAKNVHWAEQAEIQGRIVLGWIAHAEGRNDEALQMARAAADAEDGTEKHPVSPGPIVPARELLAELLLAVGRPADALKEFEKGMEREPGRLRSLYGAANAAERSGDKALAKSYYGKVAEMTKGSSEREELRRVTAWLAQN